MKSTEIKNLADRWKPGDTVWGSAFAYNRTGNGLAAHQTPILGILAATQYEITRANGYSTIRYFVPLAADRKTPAWSRAVDILSRDIADTEQEAIEMYNEHVNARLKVLQAMTEKCASYLLPEKKEE